MPVLHSHLAAAVLTLPLLLPCCSTPCRIVHRRLWTCAPASCAWCTRPQISAPGRRWDIGREPPQRALKLNYFLKVLGTVLYRVGTSSFTRDRTGTRTILGYCSFEQGCGSGSAFFFPKDPEPKLGGKIEEEKNKNARKFAVLWIQIH